MRPQKRRRAVLWATVIVVALATGMAALTTASAVLFPRIDSPRKVDAIVVVAGSADDRYVYARRLAEEGLADQILVSRPEGSSPYLAGVDAYCADSPVLSRGGQRSEIECFTPDSDTTEGETTAATRIAHARGYDSLLAVTYWGHVSRVRMYFEQCFAGDMYVTDTPRPLSTSRKDALLHETGGYVKAFIQPAC